MDVKYGETPGLPTSSYCTDPAVGHARAWRCGLWKAGCTQGTVLRRDQGRIQCQAGQPAGPERALGLVARSNLGPEHAETPESCPRMVLRQVLPRKPSAGDGTGLAPGNCHGR